MQSCFEHNARAKLRITVKCQYTATLRNDITRDQGEIHEPEHSSLSQTSFRATKVNIVHACLENIAEKFESATLFLRRVRPTVHTDPSQKGSFSKTLPKPEEFENVFLRFSVWTENIWCVFKWNLRFQIPLALSVDGTRDQKYGVSSPPIYKPSHWLNWLSCRAAKTHSIQNFISREQQSLDDMLVYAAADYRILNSFETHSQSPRSIENVRIRRIQEYLFLFAGKQR